MVAKQIIALNTMKAAEPSEPFSQISAFESERLALIPEFHSEGSEGSGKAGDGRSMNHPLIQITVRAEGPGAPLDIRLRRALKWLLRSHGLRCVRVADVQAPSVPESAPLNTRNGVFEPAMRDVRIHPGMEAENAG